MTKILSVNKHILKVYTRLSSIQPNAKDLCTILMVFFQMNLSYPTCHRQWNA